MEDSTDAFTNLDQQQFEAANRKARELQNNLPRATSAYFDPRSQQIVIGLSSRVEIRFSPHDAQGLEGATPGDLESIEISPSGFGIHFPGLDADLYVPALLSGRLGSKRWLSRGKKASAADSKTIAEPQKRPVTWEVRTGKKSAWRGLRAIPGGLAASRAPERADAKIKKNRDHHAGDHKHSVIRPVGPARPHAPKVWGERNYWQQEKRPGNLQPQDAADAAKGPEKSAHSPRDGRAALRVYSGRRLPRVIDMDSGRAKNSTIDRSLRPGRSGTLRPGRQPLSHHAARDAYADSENASNSLWSHPIYDGSSDSG
jgi:hypothetical protein